jgi:hypothetical protein
MNWLNLPVDDVRYVIGLLAGKEKFTPAVSLKKINHLIGAILDMIYPEATTPQSITAVDPELEKMNMIRLLSMTLESEETPGVQVQGLQDLLVGMPGIKEMVLQWLLNQLMNYLRENMGNFFPAK